MTNKVCIACGEDARFCSCGLEPFPKELIISVLGEGCGYKIPSIKSSVTYSNVIVHKCRQIIKSHYEITAVYKDKSYSVPFVDITLLTKYGVEFFIDSKRVRLEEKKTEETTMNDYQVEKNEYLTSDDKPSYSILDRKIEDSTFIYWLNNDFGFPLQERRIINEIAKYLKQTNYTGLWQKSIEVEEIVALYDKGNLSYKTAKLLLASYFPYASNATSEFEIVIFNKPTLKLTFRSKTMTELKTLVVFGVERVFPDIPEVSKLVKELITTIIGKRLALEVIANQIFKKSKSSDEYKELELILKDFKEKK